MSSSDAFVHALIEACTDIIACPVSFAQLDIAASGYLAPIMKEQQRKYVICFTSRTAPFRLDGWHLDLSLSSGAGHKAGLEDESQCGTR